MKPIKILTFFLVSGICFNSYALAPLSLMEAALETRNKAVIEPIGNPTSEMFAYKTKPNMNKQLIATAETFIEWDYSDDNRTVKARLKIIDNYKILKDMLYEGINSVISTLSHLGYFGIDMFRNGVKIEFIHNLEAPYVIDKERNVIQFDISLFLSHWKKYDYKCYFLEFLMLNAFIQLNNPDMDRLKVLREAIKIIQKLNYGAYERYDLKLEDLAEQTDDSLINAELLKIAIQKFNKKSFDKYAREYFRFDNQA